MFRFANPQFLYLLLLVPVLLLYHFYKIRVRHKKIALLGEQNLIFSLAPNYSRHRLNFKFYLTLTALFFLILLVARPQVGSKVDSDKNEGVEVIVALDVSNSMLAEDIQPSRLEKAKMITTKLIDNMTNDKIGLIVFAGDAYTQIPITSDYVSAKMFMPSINPSLVPVQGTAIGTAIDMATHSFGPVNDPNAPKPSRVIVVVTDGENHEDDAVKAAKAAAGDGIVVDVIGMGGPTGAPIPEQGTISFKKDKNGQTVISKLNEDMCQEVATAGGGTYVRADDTNNAQKVIQKQIDSMTKSSLTTTHYSEYDDIFQIFAAVALVILIVETFVFERKNKWLQKIKLFEK